MYIVEMYIFCVEIAFLNNLRNKSALYKIACENESFLLDVRFCLHICWNETRSSAVVGQYHGHITGFHRHRARGCSGAQTPHCHPGKEHAQHSREPRQQPQARLWTKQQLAG